MSPSFLYSLRRSSLRRRKKWAVLPALVGALAPLADAQGPRLPHGRPTRPPRVFHVPSESPTIQRAIERALDGDVVLVAPGTYRERIDFLGKAIEVIGTEGPTRTTLRAPPSSAVVLFWNGEGPDSRLMGFTITGGFGSEGGGGAVSCSNYGPVASPYLSDCILERNSSDFLEGPLGAAGLQGNATLERCILRQNNAFAFDGGAVAGTLTMLQCVVEDNWACDGGGGMRLHPGSFVQECLIRRNSSGPCGYHGQVYAAFGGGIQAPVGPVEIVGSVLQDNWVDEVPEAGIPDACFLFNFGGGLSAGAGVTLRRCTLVGNNVLNCAQVGGIHGSPTLVDSIVSGNEDAPGFYAAQSSFRFSNVQGGAAGVGCFDAAPLFVDPSAGDLRLHAGSPCIDAGDPASALDPDGTRADLGALHHSSARVPLTVAWHESARLQPSDPTLAQGFGTSAAIEGDTALIGAIGYGGPDAAFVFRRAAGAWSEVAHLSQSDPEVGDGFGTAVALDSNVAVVGAPGHQVSGGLRGAVYVYERASHDAPFLQTLRLLPEIPFEGFGASVALDSGYLVVGATRGFGDNGSAFVFQRRARGKWIQVAQFSPPRYFPDSFELGFGGAVAISGTTIVVGAPSFQTDSEAPGGAFVYERAGATPWSWVRSAALLPGDTLGLGKFGSSVAISGDALLVGSDFGVFAYERRGPGLPWTRATRIGPYEPTRVFLQGNRAWLARGSEIREFLQPSAGATWSEVARFLSGAGGALAADQGTLFVGAPFEDQGVGACHVLTRGVQLDTLGPDQAADEEEVVLHGLELDSVTAVRVAGVEEPILRQSATELVLRPARRDPGFADLELVAPLGTLTLPGGFESLPSLQVRPGAPGGTTEVELANGTSGAYMLLISLDLRTQPLQFFDPPTWYGLWLDMLPGRSGRLAVNAFDASGRAGFAYSVPDLPALAGLSIHLQALCQRGLFGLRRYSFTNLVSLTL